MPRSKSNKPAILKDDKKDEEYFAKMIGDENKEESKVIPKTEEKSWLEEDFTGQLSVDVFQDKNNIVIKSTIAGVKPEDLDISINSDMVTIRGKREKDHQVIDEDYFYRECYWGGFSRSIILPQEIKVDKVQANLKNGILTIVMPKASKSGKVKIVKVKEEQE